MNQNLKPNERELIKLVKYFRKKADQLIQSGTLSPEHEQLGIACEKLTNQVYTHAQIRDQITEKRDRLKSIIKDNATCPKCNHSSHLKLVGVSKTEKGWKSNKYKCRRCNIEFVWGKPNNPWDMVIFLEDYLQDLEKNVNNEELPEAVRQESAHAITQLQASMAQLKPVLEGSDLEMADLEKTELEMTKMIHQFTSYLQIEKIKMNMWQDPVEQAREEQELAEEDAAEAALNPIEPETAPESDSALADEENKEEEK